MHDTKSATNQLIFFDRPMKSAQLLWIVLLGLVVVWPLSQYPTYSHQTDQTAALGLEATLSGLPDKRTDVPAEVRPNVSGALRGFTGGFLEDANAPTTGMHYYASSQTAELGFGISKVFFSPAPDAAIAVLTFPGSASVGPQAMVPTGIPHTVFRGSDQGVTRQVTQYYQHIVYRNLYANIDLIFS